MIQVFAAFTSVIEKEHVSIICVLNNHQFLFLMQKALSIVLLSYFNITHNAGKSQHKMS